VSKAWSSNPLLFLGFHTNDWNFRVLFRSILNEDRRHRNRDYNSVAVQISPEEGSLDPDRARRYLEKYFWGAKIGTYWGRPEDFAKTLWTKWSEQGGHNL